jgi:hypothetical protein
MVMVVSMAMLTMAVDCRRPLSHPHQYYCQEMVEVGEGVGCVGKSSAQRSHHLRCCTRGRVGAGEEGEAGWEDGGEVAVMLVEAVA